MGDEARITHAVISVVLHEAVPLHGVELYHLRRPPLVLPLDVQRRAYRLRRLLINGAVAIQIRLNQGFDAPGSDDVRVVTRHAPFWGPGGCFKREARLACGWVMRELDAR